MAKKVDSSVLDAALDKVATGTTLVYCSTEPANYAGIAALKLLEATVNGASFTKAAGTGTNRKTTIAAQTGLTAAASTGANGIVGTSVNCTYCVIHDGVTLLAGDTVTTFSVTAGSSYNTAAFEYEIAQPT